jgi:hypothetical protein
MVGVLDVRLEVKSVTPPEFRERHGGRRRSSVRRQAPHPPRRRAVVLNFGRDASR